MTFRTAIAGAAALTAGLSAFTATVEAEEINIRMGSGHPIGLLAYTQTAHEFFAPELKKRIEARTDHTVNIQELHAGQIAKVTEVLEATGDGLLDIGFISLIFEPSKGFLQTFTLFLPFNSPDAMQVTTAARATFEKYPELIEVFEEAHNQKYIAGSCVSNYGLGTNFGWQAFSDLEGHKIAGAGINLDWIKGATPVASNLNEAYQSIQSGVYEGYISASPWWHTFKLNEVAPYYTKTDFGAMYLTAVTVNLTTWNRLPEDVQAILLELGREYEEVTAQLCAENDANGLQKLRDLGVTVTEITPEAKTAWATELKAFPNRMAQEANARGLPGSEVLSFYMGELEKLGYSFPYPYEIE